MLDVETRRRIDTARDILVGKVPDPKSQVEQITLALMYKFMDDIDAQAEEYGGNATFFKGDFAQYSWRRLVGGGLGAVEMSNVYEDALRQMGENRGIPFLFQQMFKNAYLPFRDPETLRMFFRVIGEFEYDNSERLGDAFEHLLSIMDSQGEAGQFRTPRHIIDFIVEIVDPKKDDMILDPACGTAGFLISAYKHIEKSNEDAETPLTPAERAKLAGNVSGYDISPDMVRLSLVNLYLHSFPDPDIFEYDTLTSEERWSEYANVILANPPFMSPKGGIRPHNRFSVTSRRSEVLFVDYIAEHLTPDGRAGVIVPEGIIFQSQNAHKQLRKMLVEDYLVAVISLPPGVFNPYSGVKTSILILDKALAKQSDTIGFFKVENDGFDLGAQRREIDRNDLPAVKGEVVEYLRRLREGIYMDGGDEGDEGDGSYGFETGLVVERERVGADGEFNLSGERYRISRGTSSNYPMVDVEQVVFFQEGPGIRSYEYQDGGYPIINVRCVRDGRIDLGDSRAVSPELVDAKWSHFRVEAGDILFTTSGTIGRVAVTQQEHLPLLMNTSVVRFRSLDKNRLSDDYLYQCLRSEMFVNGLKSQATGSAQLNCGPTHIRKMKLPIPSLEIQREIVSEIEGYQKVIDGARAVVENWRPRIAVDPEWSVVELGEVAKVIAGQSPPGASYNNDGNGEPFYQGKTEFGDNFIGKPVKWTTDPRRFAENTDILMSVRAPVGPVNLTNERVCIGRGLAAIRPENSDLMKDYAYFMLRMLEPQISGNTGTAFASINMRDIKRIPFPLPDVATQKTVVEHVQVEQEWVEASRQLIERMEGKVRDVVGRVWSQS